MGLRPYQLEGRKDIFSVWQKQDIVMFVLATGGGKTVTFTEIIKDFVFDGKRAMLIAHREELIAQAWNTLYRNKIYAGIIKADQPENWEFPVQVCSIQTIARRSKLPHTDLIVIDEGHHVTGSNSYGKILEKFPNAKVLIVTATPYRLSGDGFKNLVKGKETQLIVNSTLKSLTDDGWLVPIRYFVASIPDLSSISLNKGDYAEEESKKIMELAPIVDSYMMHAKGKQGVCFCVNVAHSKNVVHQYNLAGVTAAHLDANCSKEYRQQILADFKSGILKIICNVGIITEGFDFPDLQFVQLARPTKSLSMYLQMVGRVTRAEAGLVDRFDTAEIRRKAIETSSKPYGIVLDNAGCWQDHDLPDADHDWKMYFNGWKKAKKQESFDSEFEMLVYEVEDSEGVRHRKLNLREIEGMKLIEVSKQVREKIINLKSIKEFDKQYILAQRISQIKKPGYVAFIKYRDYCKKNNFLIVPEVWDYIENKLVTSISERIQQLEKNRIRYPDAYPDHHFEKSIESIKKLGVSRHYLKKERLEYESSNLQEIQRYVGKKLVNI